MRDVLGKIAEVTVNDGFEFVWFDRVIIIFQGVKRSMFLIFLGAVSV